MSRIKVIHVCDKFGVKGSSVHGVSRLFTWWLPRFDTERFDVKLVGLRKGDPAVGTLREQGIDVINFGRGKYDLRTRGDLNALVSWMRPDVLHLHGYAATNFGRLAAPRVGARIVVHEHFVDPAMPRYQKVLDRWLSSRTDAAVAVSESVRRFMVEQRSIPADLVRLVYNGAPLEEFRPLDAGEIASERARWGVPAHVPVVGTIGRLDEQKGLRYLIDAAAEVVERIPEVRFLVVGDGPLLPALQEQCRRLGLARNVIFTGYCDRVRAVQSLLDVQAFPSLWEGTPLTVFEAMAMRRAIVSTPVDGLGEVLRHDGNARLVQPRDASGLAGSIVHLLERPDEAGRLAAQAERDSRGFDIRRTVEALEAIYGELVPGAPEKKRDPAEAESR